MSRREHKHIRFSKGAVFVGTLNRPSQLDAGAQSKDIELHKELTLVFFGVPVTGKHQA